MRQAFKIPYSLFLFTGLIFIIPGFLYPKQTIDIHFHDTYFVIANLQFFTAFIMLYLFFWIAYSVANHITYKRSLVWLHYFLMTISTAVILSFILFGSLGSRYVGVDFNYVWNRFSKFQFVAGIAFIVLLFSQLIFLINLIIGIIRRLMQ